MRCKFLSVMLAMGAVVLLTSSFVQAAVISLNIAEFPASAAQIVGEPYGVAAEGSVVSNWTNGGSILFTDLKDNAGVATTMDVTLPQPNGLATFNAAYANTPMIAGADFYVANNSSPLAVVLSEIPYANYKVIAYLSGFNGNTRASVGDGTTTYYWQTANPANATLVQTTDTDPSDPTPVANYAVFGSDASPLSGSSLTLTFGDVAGGGAGVAGLQVVEVIPEPASLALCALAGIAIVVSRWKPSC